MLYDTNIKDKINHYYLPDLIIIIRNKYFTPNYFFKHKNAG